MKRFLLTILIILWVPTIAYIIYSANFRTEMQEIWTDPGIYTEMKTVLVEVKNTTKALGEFCAVAIPPLILLWDRIKKHRVAESPEDVDIS